MKHAPVLELTNRAVGADEGLPVDEHGDVGPLSSNGGRVPVIEVRPADVNAGAPES
jgi:hypothetical protein